MKDEWGIGFYEYNQDAEFQRNLYDYVGTSEAPYTGGFINTFNYRNWELSFNFAYNLGAHVRTNPSYNIVSFDPGHNANSDILERWTPEIIVANSLPFSTGIIIQQIICFLETYHLYIETLICG